jgi:hypothetical protein
MLSWFKQLREDVDRLKDESAHVLLKQWVDGQIAPLRAAIEELRAAIEELRAIRTDLEELKIKTVELSVKTNENCQYLNGKLDLALGIKKAKAAKKTTRRPSARSKTAKVVPLRKKSGNKS